MNHDAVDLAMFWVGALFVFTPILFFGIVIGVRWYQQKRRGAGARGQPDPREVSPERAQRRTDGAQRQA